MQIIILAAGKGERLGVDHPKCLSELDDGASILSEQLGRLRAQFPEALIRIVVGYRAQELMLHAETCDFVMSEGYAHENTARSLRIGLEGITDDVLWLNGDVVFRPSVLAGFVGCARPCLLVNESAVGEEEVKYCLDAEGRITELSKGLKQARGEALGINFFPAKELDRLRLELDHCSDSDYFERAVQACIEQGAEVYPLVVDADSCIEVDFPEDLEQARALFRKWKTSPEERP